MPNKYLLRTTKTFVQVALLLLYVPMTLTLEAARKWID